MAQEWTALAESMVTAIRARDTAHSILFGEIQYCDVDQLVAWELLTDINSRHSDSDCYSTGTC